MKMKIIIQAKKEKNFSQLFFTINYKNKPIELSPQVINQIKIFF